MIQVKHIHEFFAAFAAFLFRKSLHLHNADEVIFNSHLFEKRVILSHVTQTGAAAFVHRPGCNVLSIENNAPFVRHEIPGNHFQTGRFSSAV